MALTGIWRRPFIDLEPYLDTGTLASLDHEICLGLAQVAVSYTGGSHKTMGIMPATYAHEPWVDYGQVIAKFTLEEWESFVSLSDTPSEFDRERWREYEFGEERDHPLSRMQMLYLKYRYNVYFPWKVFYELVPGGYWNEKSTGQGKDFTREAKVRFPQTVAFVRRLPFVEIGRCILLGLEANEHGTVHRDGDPTVKQHVDHFISFCPRGDKRLFVWDEEAQTKAYPPSRVYWFNDSDYHGVDSGTAFRYSIRVDGVFRPEFIERLERDHQ